MVGDAYAVPLFIASLGNLVVSIILIIGAYRPVVKNSSMLTRISSQMETNGLSECNHCHHIVARYFIDGAGKTTCVNCKPEGFQAAVKNNELNTR